MIRKFYQNQLYKKGKAYTLDRDIPGRLLRYSILSRILMLLRGFLWLRKKVFLGKSVKILNKNNIKFGNNVTLEEGCFVDGFAKTQLVFGDNVKIGAFSSISCTSHMSKYGVGFSIGNNSGIGRFTEFGSSGGITIGNDVIMGSYISFHSENHNFEDTSQLIRLQGVTSKGIKLGNNIWVGAKVTFLDGSEVGDNSVVAAGAVVKGVFPNNVIIGGVPAKILKHI